MDWTSPENVHWVDRTSNASWWPSPSTVLFQSFPARSCYFSDFVADVYWAYADDSVPATDEDCATECAKTPYCTGYEIWKGTTEYCSLWFGGACGHEDMHTSNEQLSSVSTAVLLDGTARFRGLTCNVSSPQGVSSERVVSELSPVDCASQCFNSVAAVNSTGSQQNTSCVGVESSVPTSFNSSTEVQACVQYFGETCLAATMSFNNSVTTAQDSMRSYDISPGGIRLTLMDAGAAAPPGTVGAPEVKTTLAEALAAGFATCNPYNEVLRGYTTCEEYVDTFPCECDQSLQGVCSGNSTLSPAVFWAASTMLVTGLSCNEQLTQTNEPSFSACHQSCLLNPEDCSCFRWTEEDGTCTQYAGLGSQFREPEDGTYFGFRVDTTDSEMTLKQVCPFHCTVASCEEEPIWSTMTIVFLCCLIFAIMALFCAVARWVHSVITHNRHREQAAREQAELSMSQEEIDDIKTEIFDPDKWEEGHGDPDCTVCLAEFEKDDELRVLRCKHRFHKDCIDQWLHQQGVCPVCKQDLRAVPEVHDPLGLMAGDTRRPAGVGDDGEEEEEEDGGSADQQETGRVGQEVGSEEPHDPDTEHELSEDEGGDSPRQENDADHDGASSHRASGRHRSKRRRRRGRGRSRRSGHEGSTPHRSHQDAGGDQQEEGEGAGDHVSIEMSETVASRESHATGGSSPGNTPESAEQPDDASDVTNGVTNGVSTLDDSFEAQSGSPSASPSSSIQLARDVERVNPTDGAP